MLFIFETKPPLILQVLENIVYASEFSPCILFLILLKSIKTKDYKVLFLYTCVLAASMATLLFLISRNLPLTWAQRIFPLLECPLLCYFYYLSLKKTTAKMLILSSAAVILCAGFIYDMTTGKKDPSFLPMSVEGFFFTLVILYFFYEKIKYINDVPIYTIATFWVSIAFLLNFSGTFFLYLYSTYMKDDPDFLDQYHILYGFFTISKNVLFCIGIFVNRNAILPKKTTFNEPNLDFESVIKNKP